MNTSAAIGRVLSGLRRAGAARVDLSRRTTVIARGLSILLIMMHNLVHVFPKVVSECEFNFNPGLNAGFFARMRWDNHLLVYDLLSFIGWYGVPVFIFLSGFGLARRYGEGPAFDAGRFLFKNWRKLFFLMLPAVVILCGEYLLDIAAADGSVNAEMMMRMLIPLTELNGLFEKWLPVVPGVYWYLGLAFELYVVYALAVHRRPAWVMWSVALACYAVIYILVTPGYLRAGYEWVEYLRHNFTGWMLPFVAGVSAARRKDFPLYGICAAFAGAVLYFIYLMDTPLGWQGTSLAAVVVVLAAALLIERLPLLSSAMAAFGGLSAYIYIVHPVVRHLFGRYLFDLHSPYAEPTLSLCGVYFVTAVISALVYRTGSWYVSRRFSGLYLALMGRLLGHR
ncbi:MAG: acyltransferase [Bacteroides sp.]|nr:acyltransferase [Bacteroides sp.]